MQPFEQLHQTARSLGIDPTKYGPGDDLQKDVIAVRAGGVIPEGKGIDIPEQPALAVPQAQQPPPPQQPPQQPPPHPANNQHGRAMNQAHAVVFAPPGIPDPFGNFASRQYANDKTEHYIAEENKSRVDQLKDEAERQHELEMETLKQKGLIDRLGAMQGGDPYSQNSGGPLRVWDGKTTRYGNRVTIGRDGTQVY